jgi:hypothetical protein
MKPIAAAAVGAILAGGIMFVVMHSNRPAEPPAQPAVVTPVIETTPAEPAQPPVIDSSPAPSKPARTISSPRRDKPVARPERKADPPVQAAPAITAQSTSPQVQTPAPSNPAPSNPAPAPSVPPATEVSSAVVEEKKPERVPQTVTIAAGTLLTVRNDQELSTKTNQTGDSFRATLDQPLLVDGFVIAERGARVEGRVVESDPGGRVRGLSQLSLELVRLDSADGQRLRLQTQSFSKQGEKETKRDVAKIGAAAGIGAAIGAIAGGGKGAAIGAAAGGAAGAGGVAATRGAAAQIPAETRMTFRLTEPITVTEKLK